MIRLRDRYGSRLNYDAQFAHYVRYCDIIACVIIIDILQTPLAHVTQEEFTCISKYDGLETIQFSS